VTGVHDTVGSTTIGIGAGLVIVAVVFDLFVRLRMFFSVGDKQAFLRGGSFNYRKYHAAARTRNWSRWPVYVMWTFLALGVVVFIAGVVAINNGIK
jgi:hypothetical protein